MRGLGVHAAATGAFLGPTGWGLMCRVPTGHTLGPTVFRAPRACVWAPRTGPSACSFPGSVPESVLLPGDKTRSPLLRKAPPSLTVVQVVL